MRLRRNFRPFTIGFAAAWLPWAGCAPEPQTDPARETKPTLAESTVVLQLGGLTFTAGEVHAFDEWLDQLDPRIGRNTRMRAVLDEYLIPMAAARRAFPDRRRQQLEAAESLHRVAGDGGLAQLRQTSAGFPGAGDLDRVHPTKMLFPVSRFAFAPENVLAVSPPIEVPRGFWVVSTDELREGLSTTGDRILIHRVPFMTHPESEFNDWWLQARTELGTQLEFVHGDYKDALPHWVKQPAG